MLFFFGNTTERHCRQMPPPLSYDAGIGFENSVLYISRHLVQDRGSYEVLGKIIKLHYIPESVVVRALNRPHHYAVSVGRKEGGCNSVISISVSVGQTRMGGIIVSFSQRRLRMGGIIVSFSQCRGSVGVCRMCPQDPLSGCVSPIPSVWFI